MAGEGWMVAGGFLAFCGALVGLVVIGGMTAPYHAFVHTSHDHVYYEAETLEPGSVDDDIERHDVVQEHLDGLDRLGVHSPEGSSAGSVAVRPAALPPDVRDAVTSVREADGTVLLSDPELPDQLLLETDAGLVRAGRPLCYDCGYGGMGLGLSKLFALIGVAITGFGLFVVALGWQMGRAPDD